MGLYGHFDGRERPLKFIKSIGYYFNLRIHNAGVGGSSPPVATIFSVLLRIFHDLSRIRRQCEVRLWHDRLSRSAEGIGAP